MDALRTFLEVVVTGDLEGMTTVVLRLGIISGSMGQDTIWLKAGKAEKGKMIYEKTIMKLKTALKIKVQYFDY